MERKLVKQGRNALTLTLPAGWLKENGLSAGDAVHVVEKNQELRVRTRQLTPLSSIQIDVKEDNKSLTWHKILSSYIEGYDEIEVINYDQGIMNEFQSHLIGMVIEEQTPTRIIFKNIISVPENNIEAMIRRAGHLLNMQASMVVDVAQKKISWQQLRHQEFMMDNHINYCLRHLHKYYHTEKSYRYFLLCAIMELAGDQLRYISKHIDGNITLAKLVHKGVEEYTTNLFSKKFQELYKDLRTFRDKISKKTFVDGLAYTLADTLYNNIGYLVEK